MTYPKKKKGVSGVTMPCRYDSALETFALDTNEYASAFNDNGDFRTSTLVYQDEWGYFNVDDLIDPNDTNEAIFAARGNPGRFDRMNNRQFVSPNDTVGYPQLCGRMYSGEVSHFFILDPVTP